MAVGIKQTPSVVFVAFWAVLLCKTYSPKHVVTYKLRACLHGGRVPRLTGLPG